MKCIITSLFISIYIYKPKYLFILFDYVFYRIYYHYHYYYYIQYSMCKKRSSKQR